MLVNQPLTFWTTASEVIGESHVPYGAAFGLITDKIRVESRKLRKERAVLSLESLAAPVTSSSWIDLSPHNATESQIEEWRESVQYKAGIHNLLSPSETPH